MEQMSHNVLSYAPVDHRESFPHLDMCLPISFFILFLPISLYTASFIIVEYILRSGIGSQKVCILRNATNTARSLSK